VSQPQSPRGAVGKALDRVDARLKVTGQATYAAEVQVANVAHAVIVSSAIARGRIASIDVEKARAARGVLAVLTHLDAPRLPGAAKKTGPVDRILQLLQDEQIQYADQPIALVVADSLERAQHAATLVRVRYDAAQPCAELDLPGGDAYEPKTAGPAGEAKSSRGDVDAALARAHARVDATYSTPIENHHPMEPHATIAVWQGDKKLTLYDATQGLFGVQKKIAAVFELDPADVRVINHFVGGGFGCKGSPWSHVALAAMAARQLGRPVKLVVNRQQMASLVGHRPRTVQKVVLAADASGQLTAIHHEVTSETSRFDEFVEPAAAQTRMLYACPNVRTAHRLVRIDAPTPTFQRAPGESTGTFALESAMDELAVTLGLDPVELRLRNHADQDPESGKPWSSKSLRQCYQEAAERFGWAKRSPAPRSMRDGRALVGWGMATATYPSNQRPSSAKATLRKDGTALVVAGTQDIGTGTYTIMTQIAADALSLPFDAVRFDLGDTAYPETPVSGGSMTASSTGSAVKMASLALLEKLVAIAVGDAKSPLHGLRRESIDADDGQLVARGDPSRRDRYAAILQRAGADELSAEFKTDEKDDRKRFSCHAFGAVFAEVRVDEATAEARVARLVGAYGAGKILNPKTARSQFIGGLTWAIGMALTEETRRDARSARVVTRDLGDYHVPVCADVPAIEVISIPEDDPHVNEIGAKGIGEIGITGASAAIANAVFHATGKRVRDLPITVDKLL
jgi:xanthine dehydrogenase YagR molybdenum-binding subunit